MPRQARLDAPGTLHHVIVRGIEKRRIVNDDADLKDFVKRLGAAKLPGGRVFQPWPYLKLWNGQANEST